MCIIYIDCTTLEKLLRRKLLNVKMTYCYFTSAWLSKECLSLPDKALILKYFEFVNLF